MVRHRKRKGRRRSPRPKTATYLPQSYIVTAEEKFSRPYVTVKTGGGGHSHPGTLDGGGNVINTPLQVTYDDYNMQKPRIILNGYPETSYTYRGTGDSNPFLDAEYQKDVDNGDWPESVSYPDRAKKH